MYFYLFMYVYGQLSAIKDLYILKLIISSCTIGSVKVNSCVKIDLVITASTYRQQVYRHFRDLINVKYDNWNAC